MVKKIETLLCIQEFVKDRNLMEKYFSEEDINYLTKYCSGNNVDLNDDVGENENITRLIQLLLSSDLRLHVEQHKDNVSWNCEPLG